MRTPVIVIFAVYFGRLPSYFPLWITSCRYNPQVRWRIVTDADTGGYDFPENVDIQPMTLTDFAERISQAAGFPVAVTTPYKVCDARPLFHTLLEPGEVCDFWGHCDLDMIFGDLGSFMAPRLFEHYDKIFSVGHLTLYRNKEEVNTYFQRAHPGLDWRAILSDPVHRGFDEHIGVNRIWERHGGRFFADESLIADIDPNIARFELANNYRWRRNYRYQAFFFDRGKVRRYFWARGAMRSDEFMYIHFQKRNLLYDPVPTVGDRFSIGPDGFAAMTAEPSARGDLEAVNPATQTSKKEIEYRLRRSLRMLKLYGRGLMKSK